MPNHPEEFADTDPGVLKAWMEMLRAKTPGERIPAYLIRTKTLAEPRM